MPDDFKANYFKLAMAWIDYKKAMKRSLTRGLFRVKTC